MVAQHGLILVIPTGNPVVPDRCGPPGTMLIRLVDKSIETPNVLFHNALRAR
jgi:hypothetical protein